MERHLQRPVSSFNSIYDGNYGRFYLNISDWTGTRRSSDISNLQMWLETRLATIELQFIKGIEQLSTRLSKLEHQYSEQNGTLSGSHKFEKPQFPDCETIKTEPTDPTIDPMINNQ